MRSNARDFQLIHCSTQSVILLSAPPWLPLPPCKENFTLHSFDNVFPANLIACPCSADRPSLAISSTPSTGRPGREKEYPAPTDALTPQMETTVAVKHTPKPRWTYSGPGCLFHRRSRMSLHQDIHPAALNPQGGDVGPTDVSRTGFSGWEGKARREEWPRAGRAAVSGTRLTQCFVPCLSERQHPSLSADLLYPPLAWAARLQLRAPPSQFLEERICPA